MTEQAVADGGVELEKFADSIFDVLAEALQAGAAQAKRMGTRSVRVEVQGDGQTPWHRTLRMGPEGGFKREQMFWVAKRLAKAVQPVTLSCMGVN